jgi:hypothetical protein
MKYVEVTNVGAEEYGSVDPVTNRQFDIKPGESFFVSEGKAAQMEEDFGDWFEFGEAVEAETIPNSDIPAPRADLEPDSPAEPPAGEVEPVEDEEEFVMPHTHAGLDELAEELGVTWESDDLKVADKQALLETAREG